MQVLYEVEQAGAMLAPTAQIELQTENSFGGPKSPDDKDARLL